MKPLIHLVAFLVIFVCQSQTSIDSLDSALSRIYNKGNLQGFGAALVTPNEVIFHKGYGYADVATKKPYTLQTIQNIGSVSKTLIGVSLMKAIEMEKITLDTPINDILPFKVVHPKYPSTPILVRHLATHTSGVLDTQAYLKSYVLEHPEAINESDYTKKEYKGIIGMTKNKDYDLEEFLKNHLIAQGQWYKKSNFSKYEPGERYEYSNVGSALLAYVLEVATGVSFTEFTQQYILDPLGMMDSGWNYDAIDVNKHASTYFSSGHKVPEYSLITYPDGGFRTNLDDFTTYFQAMMRGYYGEETILRKQSFAEMMRPQLTKEQFNTKELKDNYGFFWESKPSGTIGHGGSDPGVVTLMYFNGRKKLGAVLFCNTDMDGSKEAKKDVIQIWNQIRKFQKNSQ